MWNCTKCIKLYVVLVTFRHSFLFQRMWGEIVGRALAGSDNVCNSLLKTALLTTRRLLRCLKDFDLCVCFTVNITDHRTAVWVRSTSAASSLSEIGCSLVGNRLRVHLVVSEWRNSLRFVSFVAEVDLFGCTLKYAVCKAGWLFLWKSESSVWQP